MIAALAAIPVVRGLDAWTAWRWFGFTPDGARAVLGGLSSSMLTFVVFAVSALLLAVQLASGQLTPRIIVLTFSAPTVKISVAIFVFAYTFALGALGRVETTHVPQLLVGLAVIANLVSIGLFFWFVQRVAMSLRPVFIFEWLSEAGRRVLDDVYPDSLDPANPGRPPVGDALPSVPARTIQHAGRSGTLVAFGARELAEAAAKADCTIELVPQVGDFVSHGDALFRIRPIGAPVDPDSLRQSVAFGQGRTLEQDPAFAFRIMIDIASRALSPAINDPTTAVLALDQIQRLLRHAGQKQLGEDRVLDRHGTLRIVFRTPAWKDLVTLAVTEIRLFGAGSI